MLLLVVVIEAIRKKRRPQISLRLLLVTVAPGGCVLCGIGGNRRWGRDRAKVEYAATRYWFACAQPRLIR